MPVDLRLSAPRTLEFVLYEDPPLRSGEVRARALHSAISHGTELSLYRGTAPFHDRTFDPELRLFLPNPQQQGYPVQLGYEWVGQVLEVARDVTSFEPGDLVHVPLPHRETHTFIAADMAARGVLPLGDIMPEQAVFLESTGIALQALHDARVKIGDVVVIFGLGALGLLAVQLARLAGAGRIIGVDPVSFRRDLAMQFGADETFDPATEDVGLGLRAWGGADVAIEFSGSYRALHEAIRSVRVAGLVVAAGFYQGGGNALRLGEEWHHNRVSMVSSQRGWGNLHRDAPLWDRARLRRSAIQLLASGRVEVKGFVTHHFGFAQAAEGYALLDGGATEVLKVVLDYT